MDKTHSRDPKTEYSRESCPLKRGGMEYGLDSVATHLGLDPSKTLFLHTTVVNDKRISRRLAYKPTFAHSEMLSYSPRGKDPSATGICLYVNKGLQEYLEETGISPHGSILKIDRVPDVQSYPYLSVSGHFRDYLMKNPEAAERFRGYNIVTSFLSEDDEKIAEILGGRLIMSPKDQSSFNSKYNFRLMGEDHGFEIPPGISFKGLKNLEASMRKLDSSLESMGYEGEGSFWLKFESQANGDGSLKFYGLTDHSLEMLKNHIRGFSRTIGIGDEEAESSLPLVVEMDVSSIPGEGQIGNMGVQAVIAQGGITITGATSQINREGKYIGSIMSPDTEIHLETAERTAIPAFRAMYEEGYRGYMTIDVLLTRKEATGEIKGYNIDPNARFTAGTPLLSLVHHSRMSSGRKVYGLSYSNAVRSGDHVFQRVKDYAGNHLYRGQDSDYTGIIPIILNDRKKIADNRFYLRTVVISDSIEDAEDKYMEFKKMLIADLQ